MNTKDLQTIKNADFSYSGMNNSTCKEMQRIVGDITDDFKHPENLSDVKVDMTDTIKQYGYDVDLYKQKFGSVLRSELQAAEHLLQLAKDKGGTPQTPSGSKDADKAKRIRIAKAKAKAISLLLELELEL